MILLNVIIPSVFTLIVMAPGSGTDPIIIPHNYHLLISNFSPQNHFLETGEDSSTAIHQNVLRTSYDKNFYS